jgi:tellurite methyltransferase
MFKFGVKPNKKVEELAKLLPQNANVLDIGCGAGGNSIFLAEKGFNVTCVDNDKEAITEIREKYPKINAINQDVLDFSFRENEYDLILAINVLNFFKKEDVEKTIKNMIKSLKENGLIYIQAFSINEQCKGFNCLFNKKDFEDYFSKNEILECEELKIKDNHPPLGEHEHSIIRILAKK